MDLYLKLTEKMKKIIVLLYVFLFTGTVLSAQKVDPALNRELQKMNQFLYVLDNVYVDSLEASQNVVNAIRGTLEKLDPHSYYLSKEENEEMQEGYSGSLFGIGIELSMPNDTAMVYKVIPGGYAQEAGLLPNDMILSVGKVDVAGKGLSRKEISRMIKGEKGSFARLGIRRWGEQDRVVNIERNEIRIPSLEAAYLVKDGVAYIRLLRFMATTTAEFEAAMRRLSESGEIRSLILDLRFNPGGHMEEALKMSDHFLPDSCLTLCVRSRKGEEKFFTTAQGIFEKGRLVVLVNNGSASSSEIVSGAVQDWDRGLIVGRRTFGKGLVQQSFSLPDSSAVYLTVARYHTPSGRLIQKPYKVGKSEEYQDDILDRVKGGELFSADSIHADKSLRYKTLHKARTVYGGGGIIPDIFVPLDTVLSGYTNNLLQSGIPDLAVMNYLHANRTVLERQYTNFKHYDEFFQVPEELVRKIVSQGKQRKIAEDQRGISCLKNHLKAMIAQSLYTLSEFYQVKNKIDNEFLKAVEVLDNWDKYVKDIQ